MADVTYEDYQDLVRKLSLANERVRDLQERVSIREACIAALEAQLAEARIHIRKQTEDIIQQPVAWGEFYGGKIVAVSLHKSYHYTVPLYTRPSPPEDQQDAVVVSVADIDTWRAEWMDANDPQDGTDCVTPFDKYLYTRPRKVK